MRLDLIVGPNGAGKSTFARLVVSRVRPGSPFVNADIIAAQRWPEDPSGHAYEAATIAAATRTALIERREPFIAETVFSHPSKLDLINEAQAASYHVALHVIMVPVELTLARVLNRVADGGHDVPREKVRTRFDRLWPLVADAALLADTATFYDNSSRGGPQEVALLRQGTIIGSPTWPGWCPTPLTNRWPGRAGG